MALIILGKSKCSICGSLLEKDQPMVGFTHFLMQGDPLWRFSDSGMHEACFKEWEHRDVFLEKYKRARGEIRELPKPQMTNVAIIGDPDDRKEVMARLVEPSDERQE